MVEIENNINGEDLNPFETNLIIRASHGLNTSVKQRRRERRDEIE